MNNGVFKDWLLEDILEEIIGTFTTSFLPDHTKKLITTSGSVLIDGSV